MIFISFTVAFFGGVLSLLPSCGPALLPAFFAFSFQEKNQLAKATIFFALGFSILFLPFSLGLSFVTSFLVDSKTVLDQIVGIVLIVFGLLSLFDLSLPIFYSNVKKETSIAAQTFILGVVFGLTSAACIAPIYGAIISLSFLGESLIRTFLLLLTFEAGLFFPLFFLSLLANKFQLFKLRVFTRPIVTIFSRPIFLTNLLAAVIFIPLGLTLIRSQVPFLAFATKSGLVNWFLNANDSLILFAQTHQGMDIWFFTILGLIGIFWYRVHKRLE